MENKRAQINEAFIIDLLIRLTFTVQQVLNNECCDFIEDLFHQDT